MLSEKQEKSYEIYNDCKISVRTITIIMRDGKEIARAQENESLIPGCDISQKEKKIKDIAGIFWTPEIIAQHVKKID